VQRKLTAFGAGSGRKESSLPGNTRVPSMAVSAIIEGRRGKMTRNFLVVMSAVSLAVATSRCSKEEVAEKKMPPAAMSPADSSATAPSAADAGRDAAEKSAESGPQYEKLEELPRPVPAMKPPKVRVKYIGVRPSPVPGVIRDVFVDENDRPKYFVTDKYIYFMRSDGRMKKKIRRKSHPVINSGITGVGFSDNGRWVWETYVPPKKGGYKYAYTKTDVYDERGRLWWTVEYQIESMSPNGRHAAAIFPDNSGMMLYDKNAGGGGIMLENRGGAQSWVCAFDDGFLYVASYGARSKISVYKQGTERVIKRVDRAHCMLQACLPSANRALVDCSAPWDGIGNLLLLDSDGIEIKKFWFPPAGDVILDFDRKHGRVLVGVTTGESLYLDLADGKIVGVTRRLEDIPEKIPLTKFKGTRKQFFAYATKLNTERDTKFLVRRVAVVGGAVARVRYRITDDKHMESIIDIIDFAGNVLFTKVQKPLILQSLIERHFKLPVIWKEGGTARAATGNKLQVVEVFTEVKP